MNDVLALVLGYGMSSGQGSARVSAAEWPQVAHRLRRERLTGLALAVAMQGSLELTDEQLGHLAELDRIVQVQALRAEQVTIELVQDLASIGIDHRVLKGPVLAHRRYSDPALRPFSDVDVLVRPTEIDAVVRHLVDGGAERLVPELRRGFDRRFAKSVTLRDTRGVEIDVHRSLALGPLAHLVPIADLWSSGGYVEVLPGVELPCLGDDEQFLHACIHAVADGRVHGLAVRDVVATGACADLDRCRTVATRWRATAVVCAAIDAACDARLDVAPGLGPWRASLTPDREEERVLRSYVLARRKPGGLALAGWRYVPGLRGKMAYAAAIVAPARGNRVVRRRSLREHARRLMRGVAR